MSEWRDFVAPEYCGKVPPSCALVVFTKVMCGLHDCDRSTLDLLLRPGWDQSARPWSPSSELRHPSDCLCVERVLAKDAGPIHRSRFVPLPLALQMRRVLRNFVCLPYRENIIDFLFPLSREDMGGRKGNAIEGR
jgi:hypothetical protein